MAFIRCSFFAQTLGIQTELYAVIPEAVTHSGPFPVIWLYHGMSGNHSSWVRSSAVERYAEQYGTAVVMPDAQRSYFTDIHAGGAYWRFISEEVIEKARIFLPLSHKREHNAAAGLSMGGFGAFKLALTRPELICAAGSFSGVLDIPARLGMNRGDPEEFKRIFGPPEEVPGTISDLPFLASRTYDPASLPRLFQCCGSDDIYLENNRRFKQAADKAGIPVAYREDPGFDHQWEYWDLMLREFLPWVKGIMQQR